MHWSFGLFLTLGSFAWISPTATAVAIPTAFWVWIEKKRGLRPKVTSDEPIVKPFSRGGGIVLTALAISIYMNILSTWPSLQPVIKNDEIVMLGKSVGLAQRWAMFSTIDRKDFGFFRVIGLRDGKLYSLFEDRELANLDDLPERGSSTYPAMEWRRLFLSFVRDTPNQSVGFTGPGLCRLLGERAKDGVQIWQSYRPINYPEKHPPFRKRMILDFSCAEMKDRYEFRYDGGGGGYSFPLEELGDQ
jgi:hypothetical protein